MTPQEYPTQVIVVPPAEPDPFPFPVQPHGRRRDPARPRLVVAVQLLAVAAVAVIAFLAGQYSGRAGVLPPPPMPAAAAEVVTAGQMARVWPQVAPADQAAQCAPWRRGEWREYVTDRWVTHLRSPAGGRIDVDRVTVARFLDRACAREGG